MRVIKNDFISNHFSQTLLQSCLPWRLRTLDALSLLLPPDLKAQSPNESTDDIQVITATKHTVYLSNRTPCVSLWTLNSYPNSTWNSSSLLYPIFLMPLRSRLYCPSGKAELEAAPTLPASVQDTPGSSIAAWPEASVQFVFGSCIALLSYNT